MDIGRDHVVHSRNGRLGAGVSASADLDRILARAVDANPAAGLLIHFHGGLVSAKSAREIAGRLGPEYAAAGTYPVFFVWESGLIETLRNNLQDIGQDSVFRELVKKSAEWVLKQLGGGVVTRGAGAAVDTDRLRMEFDDWFEGRAAEPPVTRGPRPSGTLRAAEPDEDDLAASIEAELDNDERFQEVFAGLYVASRRGPDAQTRSGGPAAADVQVVVDQSALEELFPPVTPGATRGFFTWLKIAKFVAKIVVATVRRHLQDRDHGAYTTIVEEVLRAAYLDKVGEVVWRSIKKDTADAFEQDAACVGGALLARLAALQAQGKRFQRITLVGHSTGAIYINHLIGQAATALPEAVFDVMLLAPANRFDDFAEILATRAHALGNFRMFAMTDELEQQDQLVPIVYPRSLLYLVSGLLEGDTDVPIMGMQRFLVQQQTFAPEAFPAVCRVRNWLAQSPGRTIWSIDERLQGLGSQARKHGDFDNDVPTIASMKWILQQGY